MRLLTVLLLSCLLACETGPTPSPAASSSSSAAPASSSKAPASSAAASSAPASSAASAPASSAAASSAPASSAPASSAPASSPAPPEPRDPELVQALSAAIQAYREEDFPTGLTILVELNTARSDKQLGKVVRLGHVLGSRPETNVQELVALSGDLAGVTDSDYRLAGVASFAKAVNTTWKAELGHANRVRAALAAANAGQWKAALDGLASVPADSALRPLADAEMTRRGPELGPMALARAKAALAAGDKPAAVRWALLARDLLPAAQRAEAAKVYTEATR